MFNKEQFSLLLQKAIGGRTVTEFAEASKITRPYLSKYINLKLDNPPSPDVIRKIADEARNEISYIDLMAAAGYIAKSEDEVFNEIKAMLVGKTDEYLDLKEKEASNKLTEMNRGSKPVAIPVYESLSSEVIDNNEDYIVDYQYMPEVDRGLNTKAFYLIAPDNTMVNSRIHEGDMVLIKPQEYGQNGDLLAVLTNDNETIIRRFYKVNNIIIFSADDIEHEPIAMLNSDFKNSGIRIIGKVAHVKFKV